jgi:hypothetical protein
MMFECVTGLFFVAVIRSCDKHAVKVFCREHFMAVRVNIDLLTEFLLLAVLERKPLFGENIRSGNDFDSVGGRMGVVSQRSAIAAADDAETDFFHGAVFLFERKYMFAVKILVFL